MLSDERLKQLADTKMICVCKDEEYQQMARELLELRSASLMPTELTAENGAKAALIGEFKEVKTINCPECFGDDECDTCDGSGLIRIEVPVSWTTIKSIYTKAVEHFKNSAS